MRTIALRGWNLFWMLFLLLPMAATAGEKKEGGDAKAEVDWRFDPASLAREICGKNGWPVLGELATPLTRKWIRHFRFFEILKPINGSKAHVVVLVTTPWRRRISSTRAIPGRRSNWQRSRNS
ncbi:MAG: hypothetical protein ACYTHN_00400 [Planctomycetota bacterium]